MRGPQLRPEPHRGTTHSREPAREPARGICRPVLRSPVLGAALALACYAVPAPAQVALPGLSNKGAPS